MRVDYVAQTMQYEEMLSWLLYYLSLFDVTKTPQIEIADPLGLVYSQAVESPDRAFRITLNSSAAAQTLSSRFLQGFMGAGVQHIALSTSDILRDGAASAENTASRRAADPAELLRGSRRRASASMQTLVAQLAAHATSSTTAKGRVSTSSCIRARSRSASSSRSWSDATTAPTASRMRRFASPRSRATDPIPSAEPHRLAPATCQRVACTSWYPLV